MMPSEGRKGVFSLAYCHPASPFSESAGGLQAADSSKNPSKREAKSLASQSSTMSASMALGSFFVQSMARVMSAVASSTPNSWAHPLCH